MNSVPEAPVTRSSFVTVIAWLFIVFAGFATFISLLQNLMVWLMFPPEAMHGMRQMQGQDAPPKFIIFMFENFRLFVGLFFVVSASMFTAAVGLLMRKSWARRVFIGMMGLGVMWNLAGIGLQFVMSSSFRQVSANAPHDVQDEIQLMTTIITVFTAVFALAFAALFAWIAKRLMSVEIRREFGSA